jgi:hypothetical protein
VHACHVHVEIYDIASKVKEYMDSAMSKIKFLINLIKIAKPLESTYTKMTPQAMFRGINVHSESIST